MIEENRMSLDCTGDSQPCKCGRVEKGLDTVEPFDESGPPHRKAEARSFCEIEAARENLRFRTDSRSSHQDLNSDC